MLYLNLQAYILGDSHWIHFFKPNVLVRDHACMSGRQLATSAIARGNTDRKIRVRNYSWTSSGVGTRKLQLWDMGTLRKSSCGSSSESSSLCSVSPLFPAEQKPKLLSPFSWKPPSHSHQIMFPSLKTLFSH